MDLFDVRSNENNYKSKPSQFSSVSGGAEKRLQLNIKNKKSNRLTAFDTIRDLPRCKSLLPATSDTKLKEHKRLQMEKWKAEKEEKKKQLLSQKKKPFITGVVRAPLKFEPPPPPKPSTSGRVTRSQACNTISKPKSPKQSRAQSFAPKRATFKAPHIKTLDKLPILSQPTKNKNKEKTTITFDPLAPNATAKQTTSKTLTRQINTDFKNTGKSLVETGSMQAERQEINMVTKNTSKPSSFTKNPHSSSSGSDIQISKVIKRAMNTGQNKAPNSPIDLIPEQIQIAKISPWVTLPRRKDKVRKAAKWEMQEGLLEADASDMENINYFRHQLSSEIKYITEMCNTWEAISKNTVLPESVQDAILAAVGHARLLMSSKMAQFASLVESCASPQPGCALVTPADLHGFWEMVFKQVDNVKMRFKKLEELHSCDRDEEKPQVQTKKARGKPAVAATFAATASSSLKDIIAAKRKALKRQEPEPQPQANEDKTFVRGFFTVNSPVRFSRTPASSLLGSVLDSEASKSVSKNPTNTFAMLRASISGKNFDLPLQQTPQMKPINVNATPGRSVLKSTKTKSGKKSIKLFFNDSNHEASESFTSCDKSKTSYEGVEEIENINSVMSHMDFDNKENSRSGIKYKRLVRQDAVEECDD
ncbi:guanylate kinase-associated protein mars-like [Hyposmocoma kahamanoa]|uniref:guanylate kinase-associated protein mars-like n=1 Tax=Hyposmocoma kahamanoa TaxID=1477025 RepID=UPI000E6D91A0|nr:guanylate kinase-associated protein mars-like [Hyposmocoma kahamanoa]